MGISQSRGGEIGVYSDGKKIYEADRAKLEKHIASGDCVAFDGQPAAGHEYHFTLDGKKYACKPNVFELAWMKNKTRDAIVNNILKHLHSGLSPELAKDIAREALPHFADQSIDQIAASLEAKHPGAGAVIRPYLEMLSKTLQQQIAGHNASPSAAPLVSGAHDGAYAGAVEHYTGACCEGGKHGGGRGKRGRYMGAEEFDVAGIKEYGESANSATKEKLIDDIIAALKKMGIAVQGNDRASKIKSILSNVPSADSIKRNGATQTDACIKIAGAINETYGNKVIDVNLPAAAICQQIAELITSLNAGMHTEFLVVYNDVRKVLKNLHVLKGVLEDDHKLIMEKIKASDDPLLSQQVSNLDGLHGIVMTEINRQIQMLSNLLNVTLFPTQRDLAALLKSKGSIHGFIEKIDLKPGSDKFGKVIADILRGLGVTANFAIVIEKALKTVGMTLDEYSKSESLKTVREKIAQNLMDKHIQSEGDMHAYLNAAELLYKNFYRKDEIADAAKYGRGDNVVGARHGAADDVYQKTVMDKRIGDRKKLRDLIFGTFYRQLVDIFARLTGSLNMMSMKIGTEIPLSDQLDGLRQVLGRIKDTLVRNKNIYYALIGYFNDAMSRSKKDEFIANLKMIGGYVGAIIEMPLYKSSAHYFSDIRGAIDAIIKLIDRFSDEIAAKFGRGEGDDMGDECVFIEEKEGGDEYAGGAVDMGVPDTLILKSAKTINDAIRQFDYNYRVAQIRVNLKHTEKELSHYGEKYEKIIASSIADRLEAEKKKYEALRKHLTDDETFKKDGHADSVTAARPKVENAYVVSTSIDFKTEAQVAEQREAALYILDLQWEVKKKFWATVEAVDTYMRVFTDAMVRNPDDIQDIKTMLDGVDIISEWYNDKTGDVCASVFDFFPSFSIGSGINSTDNTPGASTVEINYPNADYTDLASGSHYYMRIGSKVPATDEVLNGNVADKLIGSLPGNPYLVTPPARGKTALERAKQAFSSFALLKNLLSVFVNIGGKFGGEEIRKKVFMTPAQMYQNLTEFLRVAAFSQGWSANPSDASFKDNKNVLLQFNARTNLSTDTTTVDGAGVTAGLVPPQFNIYKWDHAAGPPAAANVGTPYGAAVAVNTGDLDLVRVGVTPGEHNVVTLPDVADQTEAAILFKKRWGVWMRSIVQLLKDQEGFGLKEECDYFVLALKSIAAKIFTVTGMYDIMDRPAEYNGFNPIRMIIGGSEAAPKIEEAAVPLYLRLPLLAQYYRNVFGFDKETGYESYDGIKRKNRELKIAMIPDVDGTFAGLIRLVFRKTKYVDASAYSDNDVMEIIRECNLIHQRMLSKYPQNTIMETFHEFVAEINRRYGIISRGERNEYEREFGHKYSSVDLPGQGMDRYAEEYSSEIGILPGEGEEEPVRLSAAERLLGENPSADSEKQKLFNVTLDHKELLYKFRCSIDKQFEENQAEYSFSAAIKNTQMKLSKEANEEKRFRLVSALIRGGSVYSKVDKTKYLLFHETVVSGLNVLSAIHTLLARFIRRAHLIDMKALKDCIWEVFRSEGEKRADAFYTAVCSKLANTLELPNDDPYLQNLVYKLFGFGESFQSNGGHVPNSVYNQAKTRAVPIGVVVGSFIKGGNGVPTNSGGAYCAVARFISQLNVISVAKAANAPYKLHRGDPDLCFSTDVVGNVAAPLGRLQCGLESLLAGYSVAGLREAYESEADSEAKNVATTFMRFVFGREFIMKELIESLIGLGRDLQGLVEVRFESNKLFLNYNGLKSLIEEMFNQVSYFIDALRPHIQQEVLEKYTNKLNAGSYYWLYEQLMEKIIIGRPGPAVGVYTGDVQPRGYMSLDEVMSRLTHTWQDLTKEYEIDGAGLAPATIAGQANGIPAAVAQQSVVSKGGKNRNQFGFLFADLIFYNSAKPASGLIRSLEAERADDATANFAALGGAKMIDCLHDPYESLHFAPEPGGKAGDKILDTRYAARFHQLYSWKDEFTFNRSALFTFNQLIAKYIQSFYDPVSSKIYNGLINQFANGAFNRAVLDQTMTYPDIVPAIYVEGKPDENSVVGNVSKIVALYVRDTDVGLKDVLTTIVRNFCRYGTDGVERNVLNDANVKRLLLSNDVHNFVTVTLPDGSANGGATQDIDVPGLYIYLVIYGLGLVVHELFENARALLAATAVAAGDPNFSAGIEQFLRIGRDNGVIGAAAADIGVLRVEYGVQTTGTPTLAQIMSRLLQGGMPAIITRILVTISFGSPLVVGNNADNDYIRLGIIGMTWLKAVTPGSAFAPGDPVFGQLFGTQTTSVAAANTAPAIQGIGIQVRDIITMILRQPSRYIAANNRIGAAVGWGSVVRKTIDMFPFKDNIVGRSLRDFDYRTEVFAAMLVYNGEIYAHSADVPPGAPNQATADTYSKGLTTAATSTAAVFSTGPINKKVTIKYDDLLKADMNNIFTTSTTGMSDALRLIAPRDGDPNINIFDLHQYGPVVLPTSDPVWRDASNTLANIQEFGNRRDPDREHVLFTSLSIVLKTLMTAKTSAQISLHLFDNVADIPSYLREKMRANLPVFRSLFRDQIARCEFFKKAIEQSNLDLSRDFLHCTGTNPDAAGQVQVPVTASHNPWPFVLKPVAGDSASAKARFVGILDSIISGCTALSTSCEQSLKEIGDDPKYLEVYQNSIRDYKSQNGFDPLMPLSSSLAVLQNVDSSSYLNFFPIHALGSDQFKLMYGTRLLLGRPDIKPLPEHVPGFTQIVDLYNNALSGTMDTKIPKDKVESYLAVFTKLLRYAFELKHIKGFITPYLLIDNASYVNPNQHEPSAPAVKLLHIDGMFARDDMVITDKKRLDGAPRGHADPVSKTIYGDNWILKLDNKSDVSLVADGDATETERKRIEPAHVGIAKPVYAIAKPLPDIIKLTESTSRNERISDIIKYLVNEDKGNVRLEIQNIIDLNIVPFNVHALMREIPLVNLYNYAYTFDRLLIELYYGAETTDAREMIRKLCKKDPTHGVLRNIRTAKDMLVALTIEPYMRFEKLRAEDNLDVAPLRTLADDVLVGVPSVPELGRPKFLFDQIFNKAIFGSAFRELGERTEMGPPTGRFARFLPQPGYRAKFAKDVLYSMLVFLSNANKWRNVLRNANAQKKILVGLIDIVYNEIAANTHIAFVSLYNKTLAELGNVKYANLVAATATGAADSAFFVALLAKLITEPLMWLADEIPTIEDIVSASVVHLIGNVLWMAYLSSAFAYHANNQMGVQTWEVPVGGGNIALHDAADSEEAIYGVWDTMWVATETMPVNANAPGVVDNRRGAAQKYSVVNFANAPGDIPPGFWHGNIMVLTASDVQNSDVGHYTPGTDATRMKRIVSECFTTAFTPTVNVAGLITDITSAQVNPIVNVPLSNMVISPTAGANIMRGYESVITTLNWLQNPATEKGYNDDSIDQNRINSVDVQRIGNVLEALHLLRFDTVFIRNFIFISNLYRAVRTKLARDLTYNKDIIAKSAAITSPNLTEFYGNQLRRNRPQYRSQRF